MTATTAIISGTPLHFPAEAEPFLPQRLPMRLIDTALGADDFSAESRTTIRPDNLLLDAQGAFPGAASLRSWRKPSESMPAGFASRRGSAQARGFSSARGAFASRKGPFPWARRFAFAAMNDERFEFARRRLDRLASSTAALRSSVPTARASLRAKPCSPSSIRRPATSIKTARARTRRRIRRTDFTR